MLFIFLLSISSFASSSSPCSNGAACPVEIGTSTFDNSNFVITATGCQTTVSAKFASGSGSLPPVVKMCERNPSGTCIIRPGVVLSSFQQNCCSAPYLQRPPNCTNPAQIDSPASVFQCVQMVSRTHGAATQVNITLFPPYQSDLVNAGQIEVCLIASDAAQPSSPAWSTPYCIVFQVQRCSTCLSKGQSLSSLAHDIGTHWTQIYSANSQINDPDQVVEGEVRISARAVGFSIAAVMCAPPPQLVRWGLVYLVQNNDTLVSIALRFGVRTPLATHTHTSK